VKKKQKKKKKKSEHWIRGFQCFQTGDVYRCFNL